MIGFYNYTVLFTLFGTLSGIIGIGYAVRGEVGVALVCLMLCGFFDMFDGTIARMKKNRSDFEKKYGVQLDSLSDVICFGALPTFVALEITKPLGVWSSLCVLYLVTSISRLAYFNVEEEIRSSNETTPRKFYTGLPVTVSALIVPVFYLGKFCFSSSFEILFLVCFLFLAICQVLKIKIAHLSLKGLLLCLVLGILFLSLYLFLVF